MSHREVQQAIEHLRGAVEFAYQQGLHEFGYDPVQTVADALSVPDARFGKPYLDGLIDRLLMPLPSMPANDVQKLMGEAAEMIHMLASRNAGVAATPGRLETAALRVVETFRRDMAQGYHTRDKQYVVDMLTPYLTPSAGVASDAIPIAQRGPNPGAGALTPDPGIDGVREDGK